MYVAVQRQVVGLVTILLAMPLGCRSAEDGPEELAEGAGEAILAHVDPADTGAAQELGGTCDFGALNKQEALQRIIDGLSNDCEVEWYISVLDSLAREPHEGPWFEDLWVMESADGKTFDVGASTYIGMGAVPEAVIDADGLTWLFYVEGDLERARMNARNRSTWFRDHGLTGYGSFDAMVSEDGLNFEPVLDFKIEGLVRGMVADPDIIALPDGRWRMYYVGLPVTDLDETGVLGAVVPQTAYYAESEDLVTWEQVGVAAAGPDADPTVRCFDDGRCILVSTGLDWGTSWDGGESFDFNPLDEPAGFAPELVPLPDGSLRLVYNSKVVGGAIDALISEDDGYSWTNEGELISMCLVEAMSFVEKPEGGFRVYYHYWQHGWSGSDFGESAGDPDYPDPCDEVDDPRD